MSDYTAPTWSTKLVISQDDGVTWLDVKGASNLVHPPETLEVLDYKALDTGGVVERNATWLTNGDITFTIKRNPVDSTHDLIFDGVATRKQWLFNTYFENVATFADQGYAQFTSATRPGTDQGVNTYEMVLTPNGVVDRNATPATPTP